MTRTHIATARLAAYLLVALACAIPTRARSQTTSPRLELRAAPAKSMKIDGRLDEEAWQNAQVGSDFTQRYPDPGLPATMRTEVRVLYDAEAMYVGARMYDPHPDSIAAPLARHDPGDVSSDWIDVIFDSYNDRRTAYRFGVNPAGTKLDVYHFNDSDGDDAWDALWDVATRIDSLGWTAEYRIPLSQLRFHGSPGEQTWGLNFYRAVARRDEWTFWSPYLPSMPGFVSAMGILRGVVGIQPPSPIEVTPYVRSSVARQPISSGDPFAKRQRFEGAAGVDFRLGLGSALSLTGTINPDFGQVEVDPAIINLSAVETFLPEKRPFFLEGSGIFQFGSIPVRSALSFSQPIHWRRIGRAPQLSPNAAWSEVPEQTTILGAGKLSGQLDGGWSLGFADAVTQREEARIVAESGDRGSQLVEPLTNYFVGRGKRDFNDGRASFGFLTTATNRSLSGDAADRLRSSALLFGVDGSASTRDRSWIVGGYFIQSRVGGTTDAIAATQRSSVRYLQRPDKDYSLFDANRKSLSGRDAALGIVYLGKPWFGSTQIRETTPGYEPNDLGYASRSDVRTATAQFGGEWNSSKAKLRSNRVTAFTQHAWNFGGNGIYHRIGLANSTTLSSFWNTNWQFSYRPPLFSDKHTRGGPLVQVPRQWDMSGGISTDGRKSVIGSLQGSLEDQAENGIESSLSALVRVRPSSALEISAAPTLALLRDGAQYIRTVRDVLASATYGSRYIFSTLRQRTLSIDGRADWTLTPALSFQLFAQPFVSTAKFGGYKELRRPGKYEFDVYGRDRGTISTLADGRFEIDPDGTGSASPFVIGESNERSFVTRALRVNAVLRWEYRGGSSVYVVWQQSRDGEGLVSDGYQDGINRVLDVAAKNVLFVKASYRLGR